MANPDIGTVACPIEHGCTGRVRQYSRGSQKLYWVCKHGMITPNLEPGQQYIRDNMKPLDPEEQPEPERKPETEPKPKPKAKSWLSSLLEDDDE
ncbi:hypothetical protein [Marinobacter adhaerens]|uniref:hypothetical protein n=1 Tax=Marinobacter adhaerens TaxID=1033846 RepID=UPI003D2CC3C4